MKTLALALLLATAPAALAAPVPKEVKQASALDGLWELTSMEAFGRPATTPSNRWKFEGSSITVHQLIPNAATRVRPPIAIKVDDGASPKALDYNTAGTAAARPAIYEVGGDTLKLLMNLRGAERPKEMKSDDSTVLYTFKRVKE